MDEVKFHHMLSLIGPGIERQDTVMRSAIPAKAKLIISLRFLATGESFTSLAFQARISKQAISKFVPEICDAIYDALREEFLRVLNI